MAEEIDDDPWLDQLREALADVSDARDERPALGEPTMPEGEVDWSSIEPADEPTPLPPPELVDDPDPVEPPVAPTPADTALVVEALTKMGNEIAALTRRVDDFETQTAAPAEQVTVAFDQVELDVVVADAIRQSMARAQATGAGTTRLETEVRVLEETVSKLTKRVGDLNVTALTTLSHGFINRARAHGQRSYLMNVASLAGILPTPQYATYSGTKGYVRFFTEILDYELRDSPISVTAACPGGVLTPFLDQAGQTVKKQTGIMTAPEVAKLCVDAMYAGKVVYVPGLLNKVAVYTNLLPRRLRGWLLERSMMVSVEARPDASR